MKVTTFVVCHFVKKENRATTMDFLNKLNISRKLKNILVFNQFTSIEAIKLITEPEIDLIETYTRDNIDTIDPAKWPDFIGNSAPERYMMPPGMRLELRCLVNRLKNIPIVVKRTNNTAQTATVSAGGKRVYSVQPNQTKSAFTNSPLAEKRSR